MAHVDEEGAIVLKDQIQIALEAPVLEPECLVTVAADLPLAHSESETDQTSTKAGAEDESKNGVFAKSEGDHDHQRLRSDGATSQSATNRGISQQILFDWS
jgi:hypothetical protein